MARLMAGQLNRPAYCALLRSLHPIYVALEGAIGRHAGHALIAPVWQPGLARSAALQSDLIALHGANWAVALDPVPQALSYADRVRELEFAEPALLLAHAYVRYLGDLSGGQILRRVVGQRLALADGRGLAFYDFGDAEAARTLRHRFRAGLAAMDPGGPMTDALTTEALQAFGRHQRLFDELAQQHDLPAAHDAAGMVVPDGE